MTAGTARPRKRNSTARKPTSPRSTSEDWRDRTLAILRATIMRADPSAIEEVKWRKPSNPEGVPVWSHDGMICVGNTLKNAVRLTFPKGALIHDPTKLFNTRLDSESVRAVDFHEGEEIDGAALRAIILRAVELNTSRIRDR